MSERGSKIDDEAVCSLARLIGDPEKARSRIEKLSSLMEG